MLKPGFHIVVSVVSVVSVVRKKFIGQIQLYGNLRTNAQYKRNDRYNLLYEINSTCPMNFLRTTVTTIWKPGFKLALKKKLLVYNTAVLEYRTPPRKIASKTLQLSLIYYL